MNNKKQTSEEIINKTLPELIKQVKEMVILPEYHKETSDEEILGIIVSKFCKWEGERIKKVAEEAFTDSNYHGWSEQVSNLE
jgi:hypothetical protein